jgi:hypothetical protein
VILIVAFGSVITAVICGTVVVPTVSSAVYVVVALAKPAMVVPLTFKSLNVASLPLCRYLFPKINIINVHRSTAFVTGTIHFR